jgi:uncharacterized protein (TIGR02588 family)
MKRSKADNKTPVRKLAEWITLAVSGATILGLIAYLAVDLTTPASPYVELVATPLHAAARRTGERFVLPIAIANRGGKTVSYASFRIDVAGKAGERTETVEVEYLARDSTQHVYLLLEDDPASAKIRITPVYYRLD